MIDVAIAGGGPAGAVAATILARAGVRTAVFDRATFPRDKLCGDSVNPGALGVLDRLGLGGAVSGGLPIRGMIVTGSGGVRVEGRYPPGIAGRALMRRDLDAALIRAAASAGAAVYEAALVRGPSISNGKVTGLEIRGRGGSTRTVAARLVIAADGRHSRVARALGLSGHPPRPRRWAVGGYFTGVGGLSDCGEMHVRRDRYIGVAPLPGGLANACLVTADRSLLRDPPGLLLRALQADPALRDRFAAARPVGPPVVLGPLAVDGTRAGTPGLLVAGDAAGFIDPMTGDGLRFALRGGELAALAALRGLEHGVAGAHDLLRRARRREFRAKWRFNRVLRRLVASPASVRLAAAGASAAPGLLARAILYAGDVRAT